MSRHCIALLSPAIVALCAVLMAAPAAAVDGVVLITHDKAQAGDVTPGDAPGYPVTLSQSGSYRLASNLQVSANQNGIVVDATEVSIDLNGFRIDGAGVANIGILGNQRSLTVRNGTIRAFAGGHPYPWRSLDRRGHADRGEPQIRSLQWHEWRGPHCKNHDFRECF